MHDDRQIAERRITRMLETRIRPATDVARRPCATRRWDAPSRQGGFELARAQHYEDFPPGTSWGPPWRTTWLEIDAIVPEEWAGRRVELNVDLGFSERSPGFQAEGLAYDERGGVLKGIAPRNHALLVAAAANGGERVRYYVEAAANPRITEGTAALGDPESWGDAPLYVFGGAELVLVDEEVRALALDVDVLARVMAELALTDPRRHQILRALERALDCLDPADVAPGAAPARAELAEVLASPAAPSAHRCSAVGHAHIDSAWLWPLEETERKCARTVANVLSLMGDYPELVFACSQAQQYEWVRRRHPSLFEEMRKRVADGRFVPVGGMWVESDTNLTGGESLVRQLVYGKRYFLEHFGVECEEVWLPDCFGYSAALPQLIALSGSRFFLTQKISWNESNRFPHHSFLWEGIDGTRIFTHFPPVDTYNAELTPEELARAMRNFAEHGRASRSLVPFGYGDGGGGPTAEMLERARRLADLEGMPKVSVESPSTFFAAASTEREDWPVWVGELYLELHRGTYTSQAQIKAGNRRCEHLLREAELWAATAAARSGDPYPYEELESAWKAVLVRQFHDILPGTSIAEVNEEATRTYARLAADLEAIVGRALVVLCGEGEQELCANAAPVAAGGVAALAVAPAPPPPSAPSSEPVGATRRPDGGYLLDNGHLAVEIDQDGLVVSLLDRAAAREVIAPGGRASLLQLHPDLPPNWDAWDVDRSYRNVAEDLDGIEALVLESAGPDAATVRVERAFHRSHVTQWLRLRRGEAALELEVEVDWHEVERFLKLAFPLDLAAPVERSEIQFGHLVRPTHENTSWDAARFERCAHRFVLLEEGDYGVAIANDASYGHDVSRHARPGGGTTTTFRHSLLRAPRFPDPRADHGTHRFTFLLVPGAGIGEAIAAGYRANVALRPLRGARSVPPLVEIDNPGVIVEALKLADDRSGDVIVRCYEARGTRSRAVVGTSFPLAGAKRVDLLERQLDVPGAFDAPDVRGDGTLTLELRPFEIVTLRLQPA